MASPDIAPRLDRAGNFIRGYRIGFAIGFPIAFAYLLSIWLS